MLTIHASIRPKKEHYEKCKLALLELRVPTLKEEGCLQFDIFEAKENNGRIYLFERFKDDDSLQHHLQKDYTTKVFENYKQWLAEEIIIIPLTPLQE